MANLSGRAYPEYLRELVSLGLLNENRDGTSKSYTLTAKGLDFVNQVKEAETLAAELGSPCSLSEEKSASHPRPRSASHESMGEDL